jgi:hypothetical protein
VPPERLLVGNLRADGPDPVASALSSLASCPLLLGDLRAVGAGAAAAVGEVLAAYRRVRDASGVGTFVPLEPPAERGLCAWDGFYRGDERGRGLVALFRNQAAGPPPGLPLPPTACGALEARDVLGGRRWRADALALRTGGAPLRAEGAEYLLLEISA